MRTLGVLVLSLCVTPLWAAAQPSRVVRLDLASPIAEQPVDAGVSLDLQLVHRIPGSAYRVTIQRRTEALPPLQAPTGTRGAVDCSNLSEAFRTEANAAASEADIAALIERSRRDAQSCNANERAALDAAMADATTRGLGSYTLQRGERLIVKVERDDQKWEFTLATGARGEWRTFYGFTFLPDDDDEFFSKQDANDPSQFVITPEADREDLDFAPSILFVWTPARSSARDWSHGIAAGLGFDLDNPIVFAGYALTYNENVALTAGVALHKRDRLAGRYQPGEIVGSDLDSEQLAEATYGVSAFVGIAFRFGSNPFAREQTQ
ncbi:MAG TPA: hypothetical protein VGQ22_09215 [Steroidobacteraceae bacterium]|jgi:hypothetical protein|nr:hypothetical protein [Steroidobacteraceae bacterium]